MADMSLTEQVAALRGMLVSIDSQLVRASAAPEGLEDLKQAVDNFRTSVWAILSASRSNNYQVFIERFRLRRALDIGKAVLADLDHVSAQGLHPEHPELQILASRLVERIGMVRSESA